MQREVARQFAAGVADFFDTRAGEGDGGKLLHIEPIGTFQLALKLGMVGVDTRRVDGDGEAAFLGRARIKLHTAADGVKAALIGGKSQMADAKIDAGMGRIDHVIAAWHAF